MNSTVTLDQVNNNLSLEDPQFYNDPSRHEVFAQLRKNEPVSWRPVPQIGGYWAVVRHADITAIGLDPKTYSSAEGAILLEEDPTQGALISTDPPRHNEMRKSVVDFFTNKGLSPLEDWLRAECQQMIQRALAAGEVEFVFDVAANLPLSVIGKLMQLPDEKRSEMLVLTEKVVKSSYESKELLYAAAEELAGFALDEAQLRRGKEGKDLISAMLTVAGREQTDAQFATMFSQIAIAATETTRTVLSRMIIELAKNPDLMQHLAEPGSDLDSAINEFLRYYPPVHHVVRTATRDHELAGASIKAGDKIALILASANFDETVFDSPLEFDITRKPNRHMTFGIGQHLCLGFRLARLELRVFIEEFLKAVSTIELLSEPELYVQMSANAVQQVNVGLEGK